MTDRQWKWATLAATVPLSFAAYACISRIPHLHEWQSITLAACTVILIHEYADHIRERKQQHREQP